MHVYVNAESHGHGWQRALGLILFRRTHPFLIDTGFPAALLANRAIDTVDHYVQELWRVEDRSDYPEDVDEPSYRKRYLAYWRKAVRQTINGIRTIADDTDVNTAMRWCCRYEVDRGSHMDLWDWTAVFLGFPYEEAPVPEPIERTVSSLLRRSFSSREARKQEKAIELASFAPYSERELILLRESVGSTDHADSAGVPKDTEIENPMTRVGVIDSLQRTYSVHQELSDLLDRQHMLMFMRWAKTAWASDGSEMRFPGRRWAKWDNKKSSLL